VAVREPGGGARRHRPAVGGADPRRRGPDSAYYGLQDSRFRGGVWRFDTVGATYVRLATAVPPGAEAAKPWGRVDLVVRDLPTGRYGVTTTERTKSGWERGPTLAREEYVGVEPQGAVG
jgi:hypothetical protein